MDPSCSRYRKWYHGLCCQVSPNDRLVPPQRAIFLISLTSPHHFANLAISQKFAKLKKATENESGIAVPAAAPAVQAPPVTPARSKKKLPPAVAGRKRNAPIAVEDVINATGKQPKQVKKEPEDGEAIHGNGGDHVMEDGHGAHSPSEPEMQTDGAVVSRGDA
jgi:hypothetical protein